MIRIVALSRRCEKSLERVPVEVSDALWVWKRNIEEFGLSTTQSIRTYRDHSLQGKLRGPGIRAIRLSYGYRAYYRVVFETIVFVKIEEVNNHDYKAIERRFT